MGMIGNSLAQGLISGANIQDGTVDTPDIKDGAVHTAKVADDAVHTAKIADGAVTAAKIADGAAVPSQTGHSGKYLTTDGSTTSWGVVDLPTKITKAGDTGIGFLEFTSATSQNIKLNGAVDPGLQISDTNSGVLKDGFVFIDSSDGYRLDIEGTAGVDINGYGGTRVARFGATADAAITGHVEASSGYKLDGNWTSIVLGRAHHKFLNGSHTSAKSSTVWNSASSSTLTYTKKKTSSLLEITAVIDCGIAVQNASGTNHGYIDARLRVAASGRTTQYSGTSRAWFRADTFSGVFEITRLVPLEWTADTIFQAGDVITASVEYQFYQTSGTHFTRGGVNTWQGGSYIELREYDWGH